MPKILILKLLIQSKCGPVEAWRRGGAGCIADTLLRAVSAQGGKRSLGFDVFQVCLDKKPVATGFTSWKREHGPRVPQLAYLPDNGGDAGLYAF